MVRSLPVLTALFLLTSACNVARQHARNTERRLVRTDHVAHTFTAADGPHFTWYRDTGREKILLLHGYSGSSALQWSRTAQLLSDTYDPIIPDLLCHGRSTTTWSGDNIDAQVAHVVLLLDSLGITVPIAVVGNSYGGGVAARLAELHPARVKKLVIYDGLISDYTAAMADSVARSVGGNGIMAVMATPTPQDLRVSLRLALYRVPPTPGFVLRQIYEENVKPYRPAQMTLIKDLMAHPERYVEKRYDWPMPVHFIWGERDRLIPNAVGLAALKRNGLPTDRWVVIPRTGHVANIERPKAFDRALRQALLRLEPR